MDILNQYFTGQCLAGAAAFACTLSASNSLVDFLPYTLVLFSVSAGCILSYLYADSSNRTANSFGRRFFRTTSLCLVLATVTVPCVISVIAIYKTDLSIPTVYTLIFDYLSWD